MDAQIVYKVAKALSLKEQELLFDLLQKDLSFVNKNHSTSIKKIPVLTDEDAINYLFKNVFKSNQ